MGRYTGCDIERIYTTSVPENVIYLAFNGDTGAEAFDLWWSEVGNNVFADWLSHTKEFPSELKNVE